MWSYAKDLSGKCFGREIYMHRPYTLSEMALLNLELLIF